MKKPRLPEILKNDFIKTTMLFLISLVCVGLFWITLMSILRTPYPLEAVVSGSMIPTLQVGDLIVVQGVKNATKIQVARVTGDIIVFRKPPNKEQFIVHRAVDKIERDGQIFFITRGDNNPVDDAIPVPSNHLLGKVVGRIPLLGYLKIYFGTPTGTMLLLVLIVLLLIVDYIPKL